MAATRSIRGALVCACALAGVISEPAEALQVEAAGMLYSEQDRVTALEPVLSLRHLLSDNRELSLKLVLDTLTGASPSGAVPSRDLQIFTRPSGRGSYQVPAGQTPLDDTFHDSRTAISLGFDQRFGRLTRGNLAVNYSSEHDYQSYGLSSVWHREFDRRNRTLTLGVSGSLDESSPEGGIPEPLASMEAAGTPQNRIGASDDKRLLDLLLGFTQIVDRQTVLQLNYSLSRSTGYLTDPYKLVSVVAGTDAPSPGAPLQQLHESRPDQRLKQSLFARLKRHLGGDMVDLSYRILWDDWGLRSHTAELRYHWRPEGAWGLDPHLRWYHQGEAEFHRPFLIDGQQVPSHVTADPRLADFDAWTAGLKLRYELPGGQEISARAEYYRQRGDDHPAEAFGELLDQDLFPDLDAVILQIGLKFELW